MSAATVVTWSRPALYSLLPWNTMILFSLAVTWSRLTLLFITIECQRKDPVLCMDQSLEQQETIGGFTYCVMWYKVLHIVVLLRIVVFCLAYCGWWQDLLDLCLLRLENGRRGQNILPYTQEYKIHLDMLHNMKYTIM